MKYTGRRDTYKSQTIDKTGTPRSEERMGAFYQQDSSNLPLHQVVEFLVVSFQVSYLFESIPDDAFHVAKERTETSRPCM
jgi:hypothetical protein